MSTRALALSSRVYGNEIIGFSGDAVPICAAVHGSRIHACGLPRATAFMPAQSSATRRA